MKKLFTLLSLSLSLSLVKADYWTQKANFPGIGRELTFSFSIAGKGYIFGGDHSGTYLNDLWEFDPAANSWTQKTSLPAAGRYGATGFTINSKAYLGTGYDFTTFFNDFWEYDPVLNNWTAIANFGGPGRMFAFGFSINNKGYVGTGDAGSSLYPDFYQWDQPSNTWTALSSSLQPRMRSVTFTINGKGYFSTGFDFTNYFNDLWEFDPVAISFTQKAALPAGTRADASAFSICDKGYLGTGGEVNFYDDFWQFDPALNQWIQKTNVPGGSRDDCAAFSIGTKGYLGLGQLLGNTYLLDFWEYTPDSACATGIEEFEVSGYMFDVSPNPAKDYIVISYPLTGKENIYITITDVAGKKVYESKLLTSDFHLPISDFQKGIYFVELTNGKEKAFKKFVKE